MNFFSWMTGEPQFTEMVVTLPEISPSISVAWLRPTIFFVKTVNFAKVFESETFCLNWLNFLATATPACRAYSPGDWKQSRIKNYVWKKNVHVHFFKKKSILFHWQSLIFSTKENRNAFKNFSGYESKPLFFFPKWWHYFLKKKKTKFLVIKNDGFFVAL